MDMVYLLSYIKPDYCSSSAYLADIIRAVIVIPSRHGVGAGIGVLAIIPHRFKEQANGVATVPDTMNLWLHLVTWRILAQMAEYVYCFVRDCC